MPSSGGNRSEAERLEATAVQEAQEGQAAAAIKVEERAAQEGRAVA
jgi:hypothetical protein